MKNWLLGIGALLAAGIAQADVWYTVQAEPGAKGLVVRITFDAAKGDTELQIPRWSPGAYGLGDYAARVADFRMVGEDGKPFTVAKPNKETWKVSVDKAQRVEASYTVTGPVKDRFHLAGPSTYLYLVGRKDEPCHLKVVCPSDWGVYVGLNPDSGKNSFYAPTYDVLADNPVSAGDLPHDMYMSGGVPHTIVYHSGPVDKLKRPQVVQTLSQISDFMVKFWGKLPFDRYVWHVSVMDSPGGGWGLEHLSSTQVGMATGFNTGTKSVMAHEYFHAWNVKRIRSSVLGPFDYQRLPRTGALWWLEGVTDYYASVTLARSGLAAPEFIQEEAARHVTAARRNPARLTSTIYDASYTLDQADNGRGSSTGNRLDYYTFGWLAGMCFDIELRDRSAGKVTLDDVVHDLFAQCNGKPGFPEDGIRTTLIKHGGPEFGALYDKWIMTPGELPVEEELAKVGVNMEKTERSLPRMPFTVTVTGADAPVVVNETNGESGDLQKGDVVLKVGKDNVESGFRGFRAVSVAATGAKIGDAIEVTYKRGTETKTTTVKVAENKVASYRVTPATDGNLAKQALWKAWTAAK